MREDGAVSEGEGEERRGEKRKASSPAGIKKYEFFIISYA